MYIKSDATHILEKLPQTNIICNCVPRSRIPGGAMPYIRHRVGTVDDQYDMRHNVIPPRRVSTVICIYIYGMGNDLLTET